MIFIPRFSCALSENFKNPHVIGDGGDKMIIKKSEVKALVGDEYRISQDFYDKLSDYVEELVKAAMARAKENGRKTLKPYDL
jgi:hypothetical protein